MSHISSISIHPLSIYLLIRPQFVRPRCILVRRALPDRPDAFRKTDSFCTDTCIKAPNPSDLAVSAHNKHSIAILFVCSKHVFIAQLSEASVGYFFFLPPRRPSFHRSEVGPRRVFNTVAAGFPTRVAGCLCLCLCVCDCAARGSRGGRMQNRILAVMKNSTVKV